MLLCGSLEPETESSASTLFEGADFAPMSGVIIVVSLDLSVVPAVVERRNEGRSENGAVTTTFVIVPTKSGGLLGGGLLLVGVYAM